MSEIDQFKTGDLVALQSGGPTMTIRASVDAQASDATGICYGIHCSWISDDGQPQTEVYYPAMLRLKGQQK